MLTCKELARALATGELEHAGIRRRLAGWLHLLMCGDCRGYKAQLETVGDAARAEAGQLDTQSLESLEARVMSSLDGES